jgi:formylglycine-generating enzyme required for sulfatase activity
MQKCFILLLFLTACTTAVSNDILSEATSSVVPTATGTAVPLPPTITDAQGIPMVLVPAGAFMMGSVPGAADDECSLFFDEATCQNDWYLGEEPQHQVVLDAFYIDQYEVTNGRYAHCVTAGVCDPPARSSSATHSSYYDNPEFADYPVIYVGWEEAVAYCQWRGARLPTEAEWEKAARGEDGRLYPWGDTAVGHGDEIAANFCDQNCDLRWRHPEVDDGYADTSPVGIFAAGVSPYGAYDMAGNVDEWVQDWYRADWYANSPNEDPTGPESGDFRVIRGGSWHAPGNSIRVSARHRSDPTGDYIGIRCALTP